MEDILTPLIEQIGYDEEQEDPDSRNSADSYEAGGSFVSVDSQKSKERDYPSANPSSASYNVISRKRDEEEMEDLLYRKNGIVVLRRKFKPSALAISKGIDTGAKYMGLLMQKGMDIVIMDTEEWYNDEGKTISEIENILAAAALKKFIPLKDNLCSNSYNIASMADAAVEWKVTHVHDRKTAEKCDGCLCQVDKPRRWQFHVKNEVTGNTGWLGSTCWKYLGAYTECILDICRSLANPGIKGKPIHRDGEKWWFRVGFGSKIWKNRGALQAYYQIPDEEFPVFRDPKLGPVIALHDPKKLMDNGFNRSIECRYSIILDGQERGVLKLKLHEKITKRKDAADDLIKARPAQPSRPKKRIKIDWRKQGEDEDFCPESSSSSESQSESEEEEEEKNEMDLLF